VQLGPGVYRDSQPAFAPTRKSTAFIRKDWDMDIFRGTVAAQLDYSYTSTFYSDIRNYDASLLPGYGLADARLEWRSNKGHWSVAAFVNNFTDRRYYTIGYDLAAVTGSDSLVPGKPRWFGLSAHYNIDR
jgi:iron complex outermembrane receptor protein